MDENTIECCGEPVAANPKKAIKRKPSDDGGYGTSIAREFSQKEP